MAKSLGEWIDSEVRDIRAQPMSWLSQYHFFRDPTRPMWSDTSCFFAPADGIILYEKVVAPDDPIVEIKGKPYSLRDALRDESYDKPSLVIGIFMTFFDVHVNRIPFPGRLAYKMLEPIETYNRPMLDVEKTILEELRISMDDATYLHANQRVVNRVESIQLGQPYYILQIADYDVDSIMPFNLKQHQPYAQGQRFSQIRYGSQVDLIVPLSPRYEFSLKHPPGLHVEAGVDSLIAISETRAQAFACEEVA